MRCEKRWIFQPFFYLPSAVGPTAAEGRDYGSPGDELLFVEVTFSRSSFSVVARHGPNTFGPALAPEKFGNREQPESLGPVIRRGLPVPASGRGQILIRSGFAGQGGGSRRRLPNDCFRSAGHTGKRGGGSAPALPGRVYPILQRSFPANKNGIPWRGCRRLCQKRPFLRVVSGSLGSFASNSAHISPPLMVNIRKRPSIL